MKIFGDNNFILIWLYRILMTEQELPLPHFLAHAPYYAMPPNTFALQITKRCVSPILHRKTERVGSRS